MGERSGRLVRDKTTEPGGKTMWMVRAGRGGYLIEEFKRKNIVAIGWYELGDMSKFRNSEEIKEAVKEKNPDSKQGQINISASQASKFRFDFQKGDYVVSYDPDRREYLVGEILSDYEFNTKLSEFHNVRMVKWFGTVSRDNLSEPTKNTLGAISTIFDLGRDASSEILRLLKGKEETVENAEVKGAGLETIKEDVVSRAHEFIKDKILALSWEDMQELTAGLLRGMGYKTIVSPKGPDRGRDIQASPDGLGLEEPRIIVEVKHRKGQMGSKEIKGFIGGLRSGSKGLYISTAGFSKEAKYEAERANLPVTLIDSDMLVMFIIQYYDNFDSETKSLIPLTKIYWPTS